MSTTDQPAEPRHGAERNRGERTTYGEPKELVGPGNVTVFRGSMSSHTATTSERYCAVCQAWITCGSIVQHILCKVCATSWSVKIEPSSVRRVAIPADHPRPDGARWPVRIDLHPETGAVARFETPRISEDGRERIHYRDLAELCAKLGLDLAWVESLASAVVEAHAS